MRFLLLGVVALVPLLLLVELTVPNSSDLTAIAERTANEFDRLLTLREQQVFTFAAFPSIRAYASSKGQARAARAAVALNELQAWTASDQNVREAFIVDKDGALILTTLDASSIDLSSRRFVQDALAGHLAASPIVRDRSEFSNYYAAPILDNSGDIAGALVARVAAQELWGVLPSGATWYAVLSDDNGVRLDDTGDP
ncbi:MAG TPA: cache domain-containing protein, partial [Anaerolineae bacterium]|nr:cache domain-containing protein [Anaerolineae bacterium]